MSSKKDLGNSLQKLAHALVDQSLQDGVALDTRLEVLKIAGAYHLGVAKIKLKSPDEEGGSATFSEFKKLINGAKGTEGHV